MHYDNSKTTNRIFTTTPEQTIIQMRNQDITLPEIQTTERGDIFAFSDNVMITDLRFNPYSKGEDWEGKVFLDFNTE